MAATNQNWKYQESELEMSDLQLLGGQAPHRTSGCASEAPWYDGYAASLLGGSVP